MSHQMLRPFIVKVSVLCYFPLLPLKLTKKQTEFLYDVNIIYKAVRMLYTVYVSYFMWLHSKSIY